MILRAVGAVTHKAPTLFRAGSTLPSAAGTVAQRAHMLLCDAPMSLSILICVRTQALSFWVVPGLSWLALPYLEFLQFCPPPSPPAHS